MVMEFVDGKDLALTLKSIKVFEELKAIDLVRQAASALAYAHKEGVVHRDVKPGNLILNSEEQIKVGDLGLAKLLGGQDASMTAAGDVMGTPFYISPEQVRDSKGVDSRTDIYSLGATLYHLVTGRIPFSGNSAAEIMSKHLTEYFPSPKLVRPNLNDSLCNVLSRMMAKEPDERFQTMEEVDKALEQVQSGQFGATIVGGRTASGVAPSTVVGSAAGMVAKLQKRIREGAEFPSMARTINIISQLSSITDDTSVSELTNTILSDFALTNKLLKLVNTVFYNSYGGKISAVSRAVMVLGLAQVKSRHVPWRCSKTCMTRHNLGRLLTAFYLPEEGTKIKGLMAKEGLDEETAAQTILGLSYETLGIRVAREWGFPDQIIDTMQGFPDSRVPKPTTATDQLRSIACFSNELCTAIQNTDLDADAKERVTEGLAQRFNNCFPVSKDRVSQVLTSSFKEAEKYSTALNVNTRGNSFLKRMSALSSAKPPTLFNRRKLRFPEPHQLLQALRLLPRQWRKPLLSHRSSLQRRKRKPVCRKPNHFRKPQHHNSKNPGLSLMKRGLLQKPLPPWIQANFSIF